MTLSGGKNWSREYRIPFRWGPADHDYIQVQKHFSCEKQSQLAQAMWASSARRQFLLKMKAKYAGSKDC
jgi:hypothetical protein